MTRPGRVGGRLGRLTLKELREILRDRRTIVTLLLMPVLVYPLLYLGFQRFLLTSLRSAPAGATVPSWIIGTENDQEAEQITFLVRLGQRALMERAERAGEVVTLPTLEWRVGEDLEGLLRTLTIDLGIRVRQVSDSRPLQCELLCRDGSSTSLDVRRHILDCLEALNLDESQQQVRRLGGDARPLVVTRIRTFVGSQSSSLAGLIPLILVLMTVTGAVYPSIDLTAGERERGTLETLIATPVDRFQLLLAKYFAVVSVALLTALVNLLGMFTTIFAGGLGTLLFGEQGLAWTAIPQVFALLLLFAAFFSAVLLALTSTARTFKEAQAYLIPLMLVAMGPGLLSLMPGVELTWSLSLAPLLNVVLLARDLLTGGARPGPAAVALLATIAYTLLAIAVAARTFGRDAAQAQGVGGGTKRGDVSPVAALLVLAAIFAAQFVALGWLNRQASWPLTARLLASGLLTGVIYGLLPALGALVERVRLVKAWRLAPAPALAFLGAALLGISLWPFAHELLVLGVRLGLGTLDEARLAQAGEFVAELQRVHPAVMLAALAFAPAIFEELLFRGYLFSAGQRLRPFALVVSTGLLFGAFHVVSGAVLTLERFLPSAFLGIALGCVALRTGSVLPGMVLHACSNGLLLLAARYQDRLGMLGEGSPEQQSLPPTWLATATVVALLGAWLVHLGGRPRKERPRTTEPASESNRRDEDGRSEVTSP